MKPLTLDNSEYILNTGTMNISASHPFTEVQSSELSRNSAAVFRSAERGPVLVTRRDGESLVLETKESVDQKNEFLSVAAALVAISVSHDDLEQFLTKLEVPFPWITFLSDEGKRTFAEEIAATARGSFALNSPNPLLGTVYSWRSTAKAHADGLTAQPVEWLEHEEVLQRPA